MRHINLLPGICLLWLSVIPWVTASETLTFKAADGLLITADLYAPHPPETVPLIVLFHQAGWSRGEYAGIAPWLNTLGYNCLAVDQRSGETARGVDNETARRAAAAGKPTAYIDALPDMEAALSYARAQLGARTVLAWGSSYSAALVLKIAADHPDRVAGVLAFSPGEYFSRAGKPDNWIQSAAGHITVPVFIASSRNEAGKWSAIFAAIPSSNKVSFIPETEGRHGARALWDEYPDSADYRDAVRAFLQRNFPTTRPAAE
jgi:pimeloyl-ACP methyl ester carboxylesterase